MFQTFIIDVSCGKDEVVEMRSYSKIINAGINYLKVDSMENGQKLMYIGL